jgi:hypothetical protein
VTIENRPVEQELASLLEWYICECLAYGPSQLGGWWADGVIVLTIETTEPDHFKLLGVTWIDCHGIAPFEIDLELDPADDTRFAKTIFRIGTLDDRGHPQILDRRLDARSILKNRPQQNRDWAMAVELTPPARCDNAQPEA